MRRPGRRSFAAALLALLALASLLGVDAPRPALAEDPAIPHTGDTVTGAECDITGPPPSHSGGGACWKSTHSEHRRLDHYEHQERQGVVWVATQPRRTHVESCDRNVVDDSATDHGMVPTNWCEPELGDGWPDPADAQNLRWKHVETEHSGSGHDVVWHESTIDTTNVAPVFQPPTILQSTVTCCGGWNNGRPVATLRALDADVVQISGVWQDDLRFRSRSGDSQLGVSRLANARFLPGGGGQDVDVELSGVSPGTVWIEVDVRDLRDTATDTITIGPFTISADQNQAPTVDISGVTVTEGESAVLTITSSVGGGSGTVQFGTQDGTATAGSDYEQQSGTHSFSGPGTRQVTVRTIDDSDDEGTETFTVELSNGSGVDIGTAVATVTVIDNDDPPQRCQAGEHAHNPVFGSGYHPVGLAGTDDHRDAHGGGSATGCFGDHPAPVVQPVQTGCNAPSTRLSALSATAGTYSLSGFSPTTYSYSLAVIGVRNVQVSATAADSGASVSIYGGPAFPGSDSRLISSHNSFGVEVTNSGESCTYRVDMSYQAAPLTECPAMSGQELVNGVCVDACSDNFIPQFDDNGQVNGCIFLGDCPFDLYGLDNPPTNPYRDYDPLWIAGPDTFPAVAEGESASVARTALKCFQVWRDDPTGWPSWPSDVHRCIWNELNLSGFGDCLSFSLTVEAVIPAVEADSATRPWSFKSDDCGLNASAPRVESTTNPWTPDDTSCESSGGEWSRSYCFSCSTTAPTNDPGEWAVTLGDLTNPSAYGPYVDVPLEVSITDWGDASHLVVTATATKRDARWWFNSANDWGYDPVWGTSASTSIIVPRRSGPPPSDDVIEANVADVAALPNTVRYNNARTRYEGNNGQFVNILALRVKVGLRVAGAGWGHYVTRMPRASKLRGLVKPWALRLSTWSRLLVPSILPLEARSVWCQARISSVQAMMVSTVSWYSGSSPVS